MRFREWLGVQEGLLNEDYKTAVEKFARDNPETSREAIQSYVDDFRRIVEKKYKQVFDKIGGVDVPRERRTNIDSYADFGQLERVVDHVRGQVPNAGIKGIKDIEVDAKPVHEDESLVVYYADAPRACIKYKGSMPYSWCVARKDSGNLFYAYRFKENEPAFYFVKNKKRTKEELGLWNLAKTAFAGAFKDPWHFFVLQVSKGADTSDEKADQYVITSANNNGDKACNWRSVLEKEPLLEGLQGLFKPVPLTEEERRDYERFSKKLSDEEFARLTYDEKSRYMDTYLYFDRELNDAQFESMPDDLKNKYVGFALGLSERQYRSIAGTKIAKRYREVTLEKAKQLLDGEFDQLGEDYPYSLNDTEMEAIADHLNYSSMSIEDIGRLAGFYMDEYEKEREDEGGGTYTETEGGWLSGIMDSEGFGRLLDRYAAAKGKLSAHEKSIVRQYHPSQQRALELHGEDTSVEDVEALMAKSFRRDRGFKEESMKKAFEAARERLFSKGVMTKKELSMVLKYSENASEDIKRLSDATVDSVFKDAYEVDFFADQLKYQEDQGAIVSLGERVSRKKGALPAHPLLVACSADPAEAMRRTGGGGVSMAHLLEKTFFRPHGFQKPLVELDPERMQRVGEAILSGLKTPLHWRILGIARLCRDPFRAIGVAARYNPDGFKRIGEHATNVTDLANFIREAPEDLKRAVVGHLAANMGSMRFDKEGSKAFVATLAIAPDKASLIKSAGEEALGAVAAYNRGELEKILLGMRPDQIKELYPILKNANSFMADEVSSKVMGVLHAGTV